MYLHIKIPSPGDSLRPFWGMVTASDGLQPLGRERFISKIFPPKKNPKKRWPHVYIPTKNFRKKKSLFPGFPMLHGAHGCVCCIADFPDFEVTFLDREGAPCSTNVGGEGVAVFFFLEVFRCFLCTKKSVFGSVEKYRNTQNTQVFFYWGVVGMVFV